MSGLVLQRYPAPVAVCPPSSGTRKVFNPVIGEHPDVAVILIADWRWVQLGRALLAPKSLPIWWGFFWPGRTTRRPT